MTRILLFIVVVVLSSCGKHDPPSPAQTNTTHPNDTPKVVTDTPLAPISGTYVGAMKSVGWSDYGPVLDTTISDTVNVSFIGVDIIRVSFKRFTPVQGTEGFKLEQTSMSLNYQKSDSSTKPGYTRLSFEGKPRMASLFHINDHGLGGRVNASFQGKRI